jgi:hypothetical protein
MMIGLSSFSISHCLDRKFLEFDAENVSSNLALQVRGVFSLSRDWVMENTDPQILSHANEVVYPAQRLLLRLRAKKTESDPSSLSVAAFDKCSGVSFKGKCVDLLEGASREFLSRSFYQHAVAHGIKNFDSLFVALFETLDDTSSLCMIPIVVNVTNSALGQQVQARASLHLEYQIDHPEAVSHDFHQSPFELL